MGILVVSSTAVLCGSIVRYKQHVIITLCGRRCGATGLYYFIPDNSIPHSAPIKTVSAGTTALVHAVSFLDCQPNECKVATVIYKLIYR